MGFLGSRNQKQIYTMAQWFSYWITRFRAGNGNCFLSSNSTFLCTASFESFSPCNLKKYLLILELVPIFLILRIYHGARWVNWSVKMVSEIRKGSKERIKIWRISSTENKKLNLSSYLYIFFLLCWNLIFLLQLWTQIEFSKWRCAAEAAQAYADIRLPYVSPQWFLSSWDMFCSLNSFPSF